LGKAYTYLRNVSVFYLEFGVSVTARRMFFFVVDDCTSAV